MEGGEQGPGLLFHFFLERERRKNRRQEPTPLGLRGIPLRLLEGALWGSLYAWAHPFCSVDGRGCLTGKELGLPGSAAVFL